MKRIVSIMLVFVMMFSLTACVGSEDGETEVPENGQEEVTQLESIQQDHSEDIKLKEETERIAESWDDEPADPDNPVNDVAGEYVAERVKIRVEAAGKDKAKIKVFLAGEEYETFVLNMSGRFDPGTRTVEYDNAVKNRYKFTSDGTLIADEILYEDGKGCFSFLDGGRLAWADDKENAGGDLV
ncbi:MAG: hypothetical protein IJM62_03745, partial [Lachnospiraceae bacterium]|nr:hypothetical protein [Lachnospiraceae bacterium]